MEYLRDRDIFEIDEFGVSKAKMVLRTDQLGVGASVNGYQRTADGRNWLFAISEDDASQLPFVQDKLLSRVPGREELINQRLFGLDYHPPTLRSEEEIRAYMAELQAKKQELTTQVTEVAAPTVIALEEVNPASVNFTGINEGFLDQPENIAVLGTATWGDESLVLRFSSSASFVFSPDSFKQFVEFAKKKRQYQVPAEQANQAFWDKIESLGNR